MYVLILPNKHQSINQSINRLKYVIKAVVAGPAGRRAPDHFLCRVCFSAVSLFLVSAHFTFYSDFIQSAKIY